MTPLGTPIDKRLYDMIGQRITLQDPKQGPIDVTLVDIVGGSVLYEHFTGETATIPIEVFNKQWIKRKQWENEDPE